MERDRAEMQFEVGNNRYTLQWWLEHAAHFSRACEERQFEFLLEFFINFLKEEWSCESIKYFDKEDREIRSRDLRSQKPSPVKIEIGDSIDEKWSPVSVIVG